jgi:hypothetical protein
MKFIIDKDLYAEIANEIGSDASPVGIDAKKTHIIILKKLMDIEARLERMERTSKLSNDE